MSSILDINNIRDKFQNRKLSTVGRHNFFSVLIPIVEVDGELCLLYEVRSNRISSQPGEVCFPGGAIEKGETSKQAAIRETVEEIGVSEHDIIIIAEGDKLVSQANFTMFTYVGELSTRAYRNININEDEVQEVFTVPIRWFIENEPEIHIMDLKQYNRDGFPFEKANIPRDYKWMSSNAEVAIYNYKGKAIWGLTGRITYNFIQILLGNKE
ncbi:MAG: CoA pyrophosphatase [Eubacteriales bacterium]|nr:CoA pyrophosphatase [Eubacteriales bacterium]MDY3332707.1 CoA pyrophosphatase [Gallibacter sp.]